MWPTGLFCQYVDVRVTKKFRFHCIFWEFGPFEPRPDNVICFDNCSPGVIITEIHKRGGMDEEAYQKARI